MANKAIQINLLLSGIRDTSDNQLASGKVWAYVAGTTTAKTTWTDNAKTTAAANPIILDSNGRAVVYADGLYKFVIQNSGGTTVYTWDNLYFALDNFADVRAFGAVGDGSTDDTSAVQAALNSGAEEIYFPNPSSNYSVNMLTVPTTVRRIYGEGTLQQRAVGSSGSPNNVFSISGNTNLTIENLTFAGVTANANTLGNVGIDATSSSQIRISNCKLSGFQYQAIYLKSCSDIVLTGNRVSGVSQGMRLEGCTKAKLTRNYFNTPQYTGGLSLGIELASTNGHAYGVCADVVISDNNFQSYTRSRGVMVFSGTRATISGNIFNDVLNGIYVSPYNTSDTISDVTITGNVYYGTATSGATTTDGNSGIYVGSGTSLASLYVTVVGNSIRNANRILQDSYNGGIALGAVNYIAVQSNICVSNYGSGLVFTDNANRVSILGNKFEDTQTAGSLNTGIKLTAGVISGVIRDNYIYNNTQGMRFDWGSASNGLFVRENYIRANGTMFVGLSNVTFEWNQVGTDQSGVVTLSSGSAAVSFALPQPDTNYRVALSGNAYEVFYVFSGSKATTGFTIKSSNTSSSATVEWQLERQ